MNMNDATAITIFFRRQAEKSLGLLQIKLQKLTFCRNAINEKNNSIILVFLNMIIIIKYRTILRLVYI